MGRRDAVGRAELCGLPRRRALIDTQSVPDRHLAEPGDARTSDARGVAFSDREHDADTDHVADAHDHADLGPHAQPNAHGQLLSGCRR